MQERPHFVILSFRPLFRPAVLLVFGLYPQGFGSGLHDTSRVPPISAIQRPQDACFGNLRLSRGLAWPTRVGRTGEVLSDPRLLLLPATATSLRAARTARLSRLDCLPFVEPRETQACLAGKSFEDLTARPFRFFKSVGAQIWPRLKVHGIRNLSPSHPNWAEEKPFRLRLGLGASSRASPCATGHRVDGVSNIPLKLPHPGWLLRLRGNATLSLSPRGRGGDRPGRPSAYA
jgi:hypothetical protein